MDQVLNNEHYLNNLIESLDNLWDDQSVWFMFTFLKILERHICDVFGSETNQLNFTFPAEEVNLLPFHISCVTNERRKVQEEIFRQYLINVHAN